MAAFPIEGSDLELPRNLALLDTNVLVALVNEHDQHHDDATLFFECQDEYILGVSPPVIVEACGLMQKRQDRVHKLLNLILDPSSGIRVLPAPHHVNEPEVQNYIGASALWMRQYDIDYVDAFLMRMAHVISNHCDMSPFTVIVTTDMRDFIKCLSGGYSYGVHILGSETFFPPTH